MKCRMCSFFAAVVIGLFAQNVLAEQFVTIGTGAVTGVYYPVGGAIANLINTKKDVYHIKATVESTGGSVFNVNALMTGDLEIGIVQADRAYQAWNGLIEWEGKGKQTKLRSLFSLHPELVNLIVAEDTKIASCADLKGKRIVIGEIGSGTTQNAKDALSTCGLSFNDITPESVKSAEGGKLLQDGRVDGYFYTVGHPNGAIKEAAVGTRKVGFVPFTAVDSLLSTYPYYVKANIPIQEYPGVQNKENVSTFAVKATLLTSSDVDEKLVYSITKEVFENLEKFKSLHPALSGLTKETMLQGLVAPLHKGAEKYFREVGLLK